MPHKPSIHNCRKEHVLGDDIKYNCGECQSCKDQARADKVALVHIKRGKFQFCRGGDNNVCRYCCYLKLLVRILRHKHGECYKKCPVCHDQSVGIGKTTPDIIKSIYREMLWKYQS